MAGEEYEVTAEWAEFWRDSDGEVRSPEGCGFGHIERFGARRLGACEYLPGFPAVDGLTGPRFTFAPTPGKPGWLSMTRERHNEHGRRIVSFSLEFKELRQTGYSGLRKFLMANPDNGQINFVFLPDDLPGTGTLIMQQLSPEWCLDRAAELLSGRQVRLHGGELTAAPRLRTVDAIVALLPYGVRSSLRVTTHAALIDDFVDDFDLSFIDAQLPAVPARPTEAALEYQRRVTEYLDEHRSDRGDAVRDLVSSLSQRSAAIDGGAAASARQIVTILSEVLAGLRTTAHPTVTPQSQVLGSANAALGTDDARRAARGKANDLDLGDVDREARRMLAKGQDGREVCAAILERYGHDGNPWVLAPRLLFLAGLDAALDEGIGRWLAGLPEGGPLTEVPSVPGVAAERIRAVLRLVLDQLEAPAFEGLCTVLASMFGAALLEPCEEEEAEISEELSQLAKEERLWQARADSIERWQEREES